MTTASVTRPTEPQTGIRVDLWIGDFILPVSVETGNPDYPPTVNQCEQIGRTIQGLARAAKQIATQVPDDESQEFAVQPVADIADAIITLAQLSNAVIAAATQRGAS